MKIIITESQLRTITFQNAVNMAWKDIADNIKEEDYYTEGGYGGGFLQLPVGCTNRPR